MKAGPLIPDERRALERKILEAIARAPKAEAAAVAAWIDRLAAGRPREGRA